MISQRVAVSLIAIGFWTVGGMVPALAESIYPATQYQETTTVGHESFASAFRSMMRVETGALVVPTVIEVPLTYYDFDRRGFVVLENETGRLLPSYLKERYVVAPTPVEIYHEGAVERPGESLVDGDASTGKRFELPSSGENGRVQMTLRAATPVVTSGLTFDLEQNVALPTSIAVLGEDEFGTTYILLKETSVKSNRISFIPTSVSSLTVTLTYAQPLRINELTLIQDSPEASVNRGVRFLAQPGKTYTLYGNPDRPVAQGRTEAGDLITDAGVLTIPAQSFSINEEYQEADTDQDGVVDTRDNCVVIANTDQTDIDRNGRGDDCDDYDRDGVMNTNDNCINFPNEYQIDTDGDRIGDECDGEESRLTERLPWVPWVGMGIAALILIGLFATVALRPVKSRGDSEEV